MKKTNGKARKRGSSADAELQAEYALDYRKAKPNRFAAKFPAASRVVVLDADVAKVFTTPGSVNAALRALLELPGPQAR
jgi:hypothetical protein